MCLAFWETVKNRNQMEDFSFTVHPFCFEFEEFQFKKKKNGVLQHEILLCLWHYSPVEKCLPMGSTARATTSKLKRSLLWHEIKCFSTSSNSPSEVNMKKKKKKALRKNRSLQAKINSPWDHQSSVKLNPPALACTLEQNSSVWQDCWARAASASETEIFWCKSLPFI